MNTNNYFLATRSCWVHQVVYKHLPLLTFADTAGGCRYIIVLQEKVLGMICGIILCVNSMVNCC